jgi:hypothetical protein
LFRRAEPLPEGVSWADGEIKDETLITGPPQYFNDDLEDETPIRQIKEESIIVTGWRSWLNRIQHFINTLTHKDIKCNTNKI